MGLLQTVLLGRIFKCRYNLGQMFVTKVLHIAVNIILSENVPLF